MLVIQVHFKVKYPLHTQLIDLVPTTFMEESSQGKQPPVMGNYFGKVLSKSNENHVISWVSANHHTDIQIWRLYTSTRR